ncbi:MAG: glycosyltransferase family 2 protein [Puniceicoccaceae bacterium]
MNLPTLDIIIVHWNSPDFLKRCLQSLEQSHRSRFSVVNVWVGDNRSEHQDFSELQSFTLPLRWQLNPVNVGFARANNQVGLTSRSDYLLLLNPDVEVEADCLDRLMAQMESPRHTGVGIAGPHMQLGNGEPVRECAVFPTTRSWICDFLGLGKLRIPALGGFRLLDWDVSQTREVDHLMGGACLVRTRVYQDLGGLDECYFLYFVDLDFSKRMADSGWRSLFVHDARVIHRTDEIKSTGSMIRLLHSIRGRLRYTYTHLGLVARILTVILTFTIEPLLRIGRGLLQRDATQIRDLFKVYAMLLKGGA